jgi:hypothetical protein
MSWVPTLVTWAGSLSLRQGSYDERGFQAAGLLSCLLEGEEEARRETTPTPDKPILTQTGMTGSDQPPSRPRSALTSVTPKSQVIFPPWPQF